MGSDGWRGCGCVQQVHLCPGRCTPAAWRINTVKWCSADSRTRCITDEHCDGWLSMSRHHGHSNRQVQVARCTNISTPAVSYDKQSRHNQFFQDLFSPFPLGTKGVRHSRQGDTNIQTDKQMIDGLLRETWMQSVNERYSEEEHER